MSASDVPVRRLYADVAGRQMHVRRAGDGSRPPLLCFHMSPMSGRIFEAFLGDIGRDRIALAPDTPGFGASDPPPPLPTIEDYADDMAGLLDALGIAGPVDLFGYHTGSMIAVALATRHPERVRRVMTVSMPIFDETERDEFRTHYRHEPPTEDGAHLAERFRRFLYWHSKGGSTLEEAEDAFPCALLGRADAWWGHRAAFDFRTEALLPAMRQPLLVLNPDDDLPAYTRRAAPLMPHGRILEVPGWGHSFLDRHTADAARLARSYLDAPDTDPFGALEPGSGATVAAAG